MLKERKQWKKLFALGMSAAVMASAAACSSSAGTGNVSSASSQSGSAAASEAPVTISWYMTKPVSDMSHQDAVESKLNETFRKEINAELKMHFIDYADYNSKVSVMLSSGEKMDICFTSAKLVNYYPSVQSGYFMDLTDLLNQYGQDILKKADAKMLSTVKINGKTYAVPSQMPYSWANEYVFNAQYVDKYSFDYQSVKNLQDLEPFLKKIKENESGSTPLLVTQASTFGSAYDKRYHLIQDFLYYDSTADKVVTKLDIPEAVADYKTLNKYYQAGYIAKDAATTTDYNGAAKSGLYAILKPVGSYTADGSKATAFYGFKCYEQLIENGEVGTGSLEAAMNAISAKCEHPETAIKLLDLVWKDPTISNTLAYGIEGIDYQVKAKNSDGSTASVIPNKGSDQKWAIWHNFIGPLWDQWDSTWNTTAALQAMQKANENATLSPICGFTLDTTNNTMKSPFAAVSAVVKAAGPVLNTGSMPDADAYLTNMKKEMNDAGLQTILDETERQLKAWKATR